MKSSTQTILLAICTLVLSSCSIVRGLTTDGKYGPNIFSFEKREVDTIANGEYTFQFPIGKRADWIDTMHFHNTPHQCDYMTFLEAFTRESTTQGLLVIHNDSIVIERASGKRFADYLSERVWKPLGMEHPALINIDSRKEISIPNAPTRMNCLIPQRST